MKLLLSSILTICFFIVFNGFSQTTVNFGFTGGPQTWTVPSCVTSITITVAGGEGGGPNGQGGNGAVITATIVVTPGQVITMDIGGSGNGIAGGYGGGGGGVASSNGNSNYNSSGGGGASIITINGVPYIIAAGGGGAGGGSGIVNGGNGGCATGSNGNNTYGAGGLGGTQSAGGAGGTPWAGTPPGGFPGSMGQGGNGGPWQTASGGGGGGGYYGGGGGGNDGCCTGANGGGGGGGGSSLIPAGAGCVAGSNTGNGNVSITYTGGMNATASNTGPYCEGETIQLNGGGGANYSWVGPNGFTSNLQNPTIPASTMASAGVYTVTVSDPTCPLTDTASTTVVMNPTPIADPIADQTVCNGSMTAPVNFTGSIAGSSYSWTNNNVATGLAASGAGNIAAFTGTAVAGTEVSTIMVTPTFNGCVGTPEQFTITVLLDPSITVSNDTIICENGTAYISASGSGGGGGPYIYHWSHTANTQSSLVENPSVATTYTVFVESVTGCFSAPQSIDVTLFPPLSGTISPWDTVCPTYSTDLMATVVGGMGAPYTFLWSTTDTQTGPNNHTITVTPAVTSNYVVTVTDGCESTPLVMTTNVRVSPLPEPAFSVLNPEQCEPAIFNIINSTDPTMSQFVYWLVDDEFPYGNQDTITTPPFNAGSYDMQMIVTSYEGCVDSTTWIGAFTVIPRPTADFRYSPNPITMFETEDIVFMNHSILGYTYQWFFEDGNPSQSTQTNVHVGFPYGVTGSYDVMLITTSELGCVDTTIHEIIVYPDVMIFAPNSFTPDGDELNQDWQIYMEGIDIYDFDLLIYNRWGELIWESHDVTIPWDGTYHGDLLPSGTYTWIVRTKDVLNDKQYTFNGHVNILR